jgi:glucosamine-6-phosphate deaminase
VTPLEYSSGMDFKKGETMFATRHIPPARISATVFDNSESLANQLADEILSLASAHSGENVLIGCPGGRSLLPTYQAIARRLAYRPIDMSRVVLVMMDEYLIARNGELELCGTDAHYSCVGFFRRKVVSPINAVLPKPFHIPVESLWCPAPCGPDKFDRRIIDAGGVDLFLLASGSSDGHVAFNPPGTDAASPTRVIRLADSTRRDNLQSFPQFSSIAEVPGHGVSVGLGTISRFSKRVVLVLSGEEKRQTLKRIAGCSAFDRQWPATIVHECSNPSIYCDRNAATEEES